MAIGGTTLAERLEGEVRYYPPSGQAARESVYPGEGEGCYEVLCGDFNCPPDSSVYRFLMGQQTLLGRGITPWHDLARYCAERTGTVAAPTLDVWSNPRWRDSPTLEIPMRFDWILLQDVFGTILPSPGLWDAGVFGTEPTPRARVVPSDHYGVYADIDFGG